VLNVEVVGETTLKTVEHFAHASFIQALILHHDVRTEDREITRQRPSVQLVNLDDIQKFAYVITDTSQVN
jgi:hypothetical protein